MRFGLGIAVGVLAALAALELFFRCVPVNSAARMADTNSARPFAHFVPNQPYVYSHGWALTNARSGVTNDQGFTNSPDFAGQRGVLVIGDSFVANLMLDYSDTLQGRLNTALGGNVNAASAPGNGLADSLRLAEYYLPRLHPRAVVFFIHAGNVQSLATAPSRGHNGFAENGNTVSMVHIDYKESSLKQSVQQSALVRYLYYNLKITEWLSKTARFDRMPVESPGTDVSALKQRLLAYYFSQLRSLAASEQVQIIFLMDGDRNAIYAGKGSTTPVWGKDDHELFVRLARSFGHDVIDMQPLFERHWAQHHERMDFLPMDGHWNAVAHKLAADELLKHFDHSRLSRD